MIDVDLAEEAEVLDGSAPGLAEDADAVRVVDDHDRVVLARELDDLGELREVALHREDAVRDDQLACARAAPPRARRAARPCPSAGR